MIVRFIMHAEDWQQMQVVLRQVTIILQPENFNFFSKLF